MTQTDGLEKDGLGHPFLCLPSTGGRLKIAPGIFCTSTVHGGRIPQGARKAVRLFTGLVTEKCQLKLIANSCHAGFVYA